VLAEVHGRNSGISSLEQEYVVLLNFGVELDMEGWSVTDRDGHTFVFPDFRLGSGEGVRLYTGQGYNSANELFWGRNSTLWAADSDTVYLIDDEGVLIDQYTY
jgi:hypothetical protein